MHEQHPADVRRADHARPTTAERVFAPADTLFARIRHQTALLAAADELARESAPQGDDSPARWSRLLRDYAIASDRVLSVDGDAEAATLGWLKPRGIVSLLVTEECDDEHAVENLAAALAAMNAVTLTVDVERSERLRAVVTVLSRLLPDAFIELPVHPHAHYPAIAAAAVLTEDVLYRSWAPAAALTGPATSEEDRVALMILYGRVRQLDVRAV
ncbi:hypothetical protein SAMN06295885_2872 [Rathayibacter oskolensis]|uniref:Uncharacterized protein n=1 Tax=Rathayibacter oskolensis TaxID=1891671 RepID=A0A1X7P8Y5_9MICO|nr:hypothetical protein [Rathayibacter oskolensis]SMH46976.1 hypothetical protein SAMN06295885_2872 [Rathayibacter oskolensis]